MGARQSLLGRRTAADNLAVNLGGSFAALTGSAPQDPVDRRFEAEIAVLEAEETPPTTFLIDGSGIGKAAYDLFGRMRDALWRLPHNWVLVIDEGERGTVLRPPADAFFDVELSLDTWTEGLLGQMVELRGASDTLSESVLSAILGSAGTPRAVLRAANDAVVSGFGTTRLKANGDLISQAERLGGPHGLLMAELVDLGQASPSDNALSTRMGLSRARITALLRELLEANLVEATPVRSEGPGRPKTVYRPLLEVT